MRGKSEGFGEITWFAGQRKTIEIDHQVTANEGEIVRMLQSLTGGSGPSEAVRGHNTKEATTKPLEKKGLDIEKSRTRGIEGKYSLMNKPSLENKISAIFDSLTKTFFFHFFSHELMNFMGCIRNFTLDQCYGDYLKTHHSMMEPMRRMADMKARIHNFGRLMCGMDGNGYNVTGLPKNITDLLKCKKEFYDNGKGCAKQFHDKFKAKAKPEDLCK